MDFLSDELKKVEWSTSTPEEVRDVIRPCVKDIDDCSACVKHDIEECSGDVAAKVRAAAVAKVHIETVKILRSFTTVLEVACRQSKGD